MELEEIDIKALDKAKESLADCFPWDETPEGAAYWEEVYLRLETHQTKAENGIVWNGNLDGLPLPRILNKNKPFELVEESQATEIIHVRYEGNVACGLKGLPWQWPKNHTWVFLKDKEHSNCGACTDALIKKGLL